MNELRINENEMIVVIVISNSINSKYCHSVLLEEIFNAANITLEMRGNCILSSIYYLLHCFQNHKSHI